MTDKSQPFTQPDAVYLEKTTQDFVDSLEGSPPIYTLPPEEARQVLVDAQRDAKVAMPDAQAEDVDWPIGPEGVTCIRIYRPILSNEVSGPLPAIIYSHGGGWVLGDKETHERLVRELVSTSGAVAFFVDYERSPEAQFPTANEQFYATLEHVAQNASELGVDPARIIVAGDSVGGNMATVAALMAKERGGPKIAAQLLIYPVTDASMSTPSYSQFADGPWLEREGMKWFWDQYLPVESQRDDKFVSPINATLEELADLPPALVITDENDVLRDEGELYARKLAEAGVRTTSLRINGTMHDFMLLNALSETPATRAAVDHVAAYLRTLFSR